MNVLDSSANTVGEASADGTGLLASRSGTVSRVAQVLSALADAPGLVGVGELAHTVGLPNSTVHRLLALLQGEGLVQMEPESHRYSTGPEFYRLAALVVAKVDIATMAMPFLHELVLRFNETTLLAMHMPVQRAMMFIAREDGSQALQYRIDLHSPLSLVWGASGKALLAFLDDATIEKTIASEGPGPVSGLPLPDRKEILAELARIRRQGYAVSEAEKLPGARGVAVPVFNTKGAVGSLCLTSPKERVPHSSIDDIARHLGIAARELSRRLGATGDTTSRASMTAWNMEMSKR